MSDTSKKSPIKSGWKGNIQGYIEQTDSQIRVKTIQVDIDSTTAWALCNLLSDHALSTAGHLLDDVQIPPLRNLGAAIAMFIDHPTKNFKDLTTEEKPE